MTNNVDTIREFFKGKGFTTAGIASILGNWQVESGFNPLAYNANEGAIGEAQWEGGRRRNLDTFASQTGGSETNLLTQLQYAYHEMQTSYPNVLNELRTVQDPAEGAAYFDQYYEVSSGSSRSQRIADAINYFHNGLTSTDATSNIGSGSAGSDTSSSTITNANGTVATPVFSLNDLKNGAVGFLPLGPLEWLAKNPINSVTDAIKALDGVMGFIGEFFHKLLWIFTPSHFIKFNLYLLGIFLILFGLYFLFRGSVASGETSAAQ